MKNIKNARVVQDFREVLSKHPIAFTDTLIVAIGIVLAIGLRYSLRAFQSQDFVNIIQYWYQVIKKDGFAALGQDFSNYAPPYLYMLYLVSLVFPRVASVTAVKLPAIICDFVCAAYVYKVVRLKYAEGPIPIFAFLAILFAPTVVLNSAAWSQIESIYTAALVAFVYYILKKQNWLACIAFGIAFSIKLQTIYLAPLLIALLLKKTISWKHLLVIPVVYFVLIIPAWIAGRPFVELLTIYASQVGGYSGLVHNAPNMYTWLPANLSDMLTPAGVIFALSICFIYVVVITKSRIAISKDLVIQLALVSALIVPYFLPKTHDRYFYPADVLSIVFAFYYPEYFYLSLAINLISFFVYLPFLFGMEIIPQPLLALALLIVIIVLIRQMVAAFYKAAPES
ncbi:MAG TPA: hypothetical protein VMC09_18915 [Anaerolineales bacterium]|nr:hypothetical protein [Anaerolineales bacterium]